MPAKLIIRGAALLMAFGLVFQAQAEPSPKPAVPAVAATPIMGWNPWNAFRTEVTEAKIMAIIETLERSGLQKAGYRYVNIDDGWWLKRRTDGRIEVRTSMFPSAALANGETSFRPFVDRLHAKGFKVGIYTDIGRNACSQAWDLKSPNLPVGTQAEREVGAMDHQAEDMRLFFGEWNFDLVKVDACGLADFGPDRPYVKDGRFRAMTPDIIRGRPDLSNLTRVEGLYRDLKQAMDKVRPNGDVILSICTWGEAEVANWGGKYGQQWRTSADIRPKWTSMLHNFDSAAQPESAGPGHWNDPDMLEIGNGEFDAHHLTEARAHMSMWAIINAPLILGSDLTQWPQSLFDIAGNVEVIAINQDRAGKQGVTVAKTEDTQLVVKTLADPNVRVVALINRSNAPQSIPVTLSQLQIPSGSKVKVRDLWFPAKPYSFKNGKLTVSLAPHETVLLRVTRQK